MLKKVSIAFALVISMPMVAIAADAGAGKAKSSMCVGCHGTNGVSMVPSYPNLKGQKAAYIEASLKAYRDKSRKGGQAAIMYGMAAALSDADIANLGAYYNSLK